MTDELKIQKRILELLEVLVKSKLSENIKQETEDPKRKLLYELTGKANIKTIVQRTGFSAGKVSGIWKKWESTGILKRDGQSYSRIV